MRAAIRLVKEGGAHAVKLEGGTAVAGATGRIVAAGIPVMGHVGLLCLVCLRRLQPRAGVCLVAGVVAIFLKIFTLGGLYPGPIVGIAVQALALEIALTGSGGRAVGAAIGGFFALATNPLQKVGMMWVVAGTDAVRAYLIANNTLPGNLITAVGYGPSRPLAPNETAEGRAINRRIDVVIKPTKK